MNMKRILLFVFVLLTIQFVSAQRTVKIKLIHTTDVHGCYFPYDFAQQKESNGSLARVSEYVKNLRKTYHHNLLLFDNGDILQGQPTSYYYNYIDTTSTHLCAAIMNEMKYDVGNLGNHDVETGIHVFSRWAKECQFPIICANAVKVSNGEPFFTPYKVFVRDGVKIVVMGMITSCIPCWLSEDLYPGLRFDDMETTARKWIPIIKAKENPDIIVGLFHSGIEAQTMAGKYRENASQEVAEHVPGFDIIMAGHDHEQYCKWIKNLAGQSVLIINPGKGGADVSEVDIKIVKGKGNHTISKKITAQLTPMPSTGIDPVFMTEFKPQLDTLKQFVSHKLGTLDEDIPIMPAYFGPSSFIDAIHYVQLQLTGASISFSAPFSMTAYVKKGDFTVSDLFNLYKYENKLYVMQLTGKEIKNYLEESYSRWFNQMHSPNDHLFLLKEEENNNTSFLNLAFNFDSAAGLYYTVDVTKPKGEKIQIQKMANGEPFFMDKTYEVVLNSYRGNGGGELLTLGAGIPAKQLKERTIFISDKELRFYLMKYIEQHGTSFFKPLNQWKTIPESWTKAAGERDAKLLFKKEIH